MYPDIDWSENNLMEGIADAVLPGIDSLVARGFVDASRVGLLGHSSGGYSVLSLLVQSDRFKAAVQSSGWGTSDMMSMYLTGLERRTGASWVTSQMGLRVPPWQNSDVYVQNSPAFFLDRVKAPLLMPQGVVNDELGTKQSDQLYAGLRELRRSVEYRRYELEGHSPDSWSAPASQDAARRVLEWIEQCLP